jgi:hypothetical protein
MKLTKTFLNKFIIWSNSRYNEYKKFQVINFILNGFKEGRTGKHYFSCGSYCPCSSMTGVADYLVDFDNREIVKGYINDNKIIVKEVGRIKVDNV